MEGKTFNCPYLGGYSCLYCFHAKKEKKKKECLEKYSAFLKFSEVKFSEIALAQALVYHRWVCSRVVVYCLFIFVDLLLFPPPPPQMFNVA